jgi:hypothetical protein
MSTLEHDIKNSLNTVKLGISALDSILPKLITSYRARPHQATAEPIISNKQLDILANIQKELLSTIKKLETDFDKLHTTDGDKN